MKELIDYDLHDGGDVVPIVQPFKYRGKSYTLEEAMEGGVIEWRNACQRSFKTGPSGERYIDGLADVQVLLLSKCIHDASGVLVSSVELRNWQPKVIRDLYKQAMTFNELNEADDLTERDINERIDQLQKRLKTLKESGEPAKNG